MAAPVASETESMRSASGH